MPKAPLRQRQVVWHLVTHPADLHHPQEVAQRLGCSVAAVKLALSKLRHRLGRVDLEYLCPECLTLSRFAGVCHRCGVEVPAVPASIHSIFSHEIRNRIHDGFPQIPLPVSHGTKRFLQGDGPTRLTQYLLSRLDQLFKAYMPPHEVTHRAALICGHETHDYLTDNGHRLRREDKLAILTRTLLACEVAMPQHTRMWRAMLAQLLTVPQVVLYG